MRPIQKVRDVLFVVVVSAIGIAIAFGLIIFGKSVIEAFGWKWPVTIVSVVAALVTVFYYGDKADTEDEKQSDRAVTEAKLIIADEPTLQQCPCCGHEFDEDDYEDEDA